MYRALHRKANSREYVRKHPQDKDVTTRAPRELTNHRFHLNAKVRKYGIESEEIKLSWEDIDAIPCITDKKSSEYIKVNNQYILKEREDI